MANKSPKASAIRAWFPFFPDDWRSSISVSMMSAEERGVYIHLLGYCWTEGCSLPSDWSVLARLASVTEVSDRVRDMFIPHPEIKGRLTNARLLAVFHRQTATLQKRQASADRTNRIRWQSRSESVTDSVTDTVTDRPEGSVTDRDREREKEREKDNGGTSYPLSSSSLRSDEDPHVLPQVRTANPLEGDRETEEARTGEGPGERARGPGRPACPVQKIIELYHEVLPELPAVRVVGKQLTQYLQSRWREDKARQDLAWWGSYFRQVSESAFLMGESEGRDGMPPFRADLTWLVRPTNLEKVLNGRYSRDRRHRSMSRDVEEFLKATEQPLRVIQGGGR